MRFVQQADGGLALGGSCLPLRIDACSERLLRVRIGVGDWQSYLPQRAWPDATTLAVSAAGDEVGSGELPLAPDGGRLDFRDASGSPRLRLDLGALAAAATTRLRFEIVGEQQFYGLGHGGQPFDRLGASRRLWNCHINHGPGSDIAIPLLLS